MHICFGYAAIIHERPERLLVPARAGRDRLRAGAASRPRSRGSTLGVLDSLPAKTIILGVLDLSTDEVETPETVAERIRRAFPHTERA